MIFRRRRGPARRLIALGAALAVQLWSLAPVAASVIYCIGEDGHSGFELVKAGARGCADCCHEGENGAPRIEGAPVSECTDIALSPETGVAGKVSEAPVAVSFVTALLPASVASERAWRYRDVGLDPPRGSSTRMLRRTVLLI